MGDCESVSFRFPSFPFEGTTELLPKDVRIFPSASKSTTDGFKAKIFLGEFLLPQKMKLTWGCL